MALVLILAVGACTSGGNCSEPPEDELRTDDSAFEIDAEPNPVTAGAQATLSVSASEEMSRDFVGGLGVDWECWDGSEWIKTHTLVRDAIGPPEVIKEGSLSNTAIPDLGLQVPNSHQIVIPDVAPGTYRLVDRLFAFQTEQVGYEVVRVIDN